MRLFPIVAIIFVARHFLIIIRAVERVGVVDFCERHNPNSCGEAGGECVQFFAGTRCQCPPGRMGPGCKRPCQDVQRSCHKWRQEGRCEWHKSTLSPFFIDNCARTCQFCRAVPGQKILPCAMAPMLEPIAWLVGRWQTQTLGTRADRFPALFSGPYFEILDVQIGDPPAFDRPSLNVSVRAWAMAGLEQHQELGFLTLKPATEQTGFVDQRLDTANHLVALELASNTGVVTIEEGELIAQGHLQLETTWHKYFIGTNGTEDNHGIQLDMARRSFLLVEPNVLEERLDYMASGNDAKRRKVMKRFRRIYDYFEGE